MGQDGAVVDPFQSARLGPLTLRNRFLKAATFEGMADNGLVSDRLVEFHRDIAAGGVAMTTLAYLAVSEEGRGAPNEIVVRPEAARGLQHLADAVHAEGALVSAQIGHAGPVAAATGGRALTPSRLFSPVSMGFTRAATPFDIQRVIEDFAASAAIVRDAGFDAVEVHLGHGYLLSSFLSPDTNRRKDEWGGSLAARAELPRRVLSAVREAVGPHCAVLAKLNMNDGTPHGLLEPESLAVAQLIEREGTVDALVLTGGSSFRNPMYLLRGDVPLRELAANFPLHIRAGMRLFGRGFLRSYPFEEGFFLQQAEQFRAALAMPIVALGGINRLDTMQRALDSGFEFVALGRALLHEPGIVNRWRDGNRAPGACTHCNRCMPTIYSGTHCPLVSR